MLDGTQDKATVNPDGERLAKVPVGVTFRRITTHIDDRGNVFEMFDPRWHWHPDVIEFVYCFTIRPGVTKGWGLHKKHEDRYCIMYGELLVVLYDDRPESPTRGLVSEIILSEFDRRLMNIPAGVWHADRNIGTKDAIVVNFPTIKYDHAAPDKYRLPLDTDKIPYKFDQPKGW